MSDGPASLPGGARLRRLDAGDAPAVLDAFLRNREHLRSNDPVRPESFWTLEGQQTRLRAILQEQQDGRLLGCVIQRDGRVLGCVTLTNIVRGPFRSANLGYWVDVAEVGRGLATAAVAAMCRIADQELGLHRIEASTLLWNMASQRVLLKNGFQQFGMAPNYLHLSGEWQDCRLFQRILNDRPPADP